MLSQASLSGIPRTIWIKIFCRCAHPLHCLFFAPVVTIGGHKLLDGAIVEPIPISKSIADGYQKFVIVLTRNAGYRKKHPVPQYLLRLVYKHYPKLWETMARRPDYIMTSLLLPNNWNRTARRYHPSNRTFKDRQTGPETAAAFKAARSRYRMRISKISRNHAALS